MKTDGTYSVVSYRASSRSDTVHKFTLTKKKLTLKGTLYKNSKKLKGSSFTFRVSPKVWVGEYEWDTPPYKKYTGAKKREAVNRWNRCEFIGITIKVKNGKVIRLVSSA